MAKSSCAAGAGRRRRACAADRCCAGPARGSGTSTSGRRAARRARRARCARRGRRVSLPRATTRVKPSSSASSQRTSTPPGARRVAGRGRVHSTKLSACGWPEATPRAKRARRPRAHGAARQGARRRAPPACSSCGDAGRRCVRHGNHAQTRYRRSDPDLVDLAVDVAQPHLRAGGPSGQGRSASLSEALACQEAAARRLSIFWITPSLQLLHRDDRGAEAERAELLARLLEPAKSCRAPGCARARSASRAEAVEQARAACSTASARA